MIADVRYEPQRLLIGGPAASVLAGAVTSASASPAADSAPTRFRTGEARTDRHRTACIGCGPPSGPLMIFLHGFPELGIVWKAQMTFFATRGWRCVAPDMRGYGGSSAPTDVADYSVEAISTDMVELHRTLGGRPAIWVGHDWGAPIGWAMASHHLERCRGVVALTTPYHPRGHALPNLVPLVDRTLYPIADYPVGQWEAAAKPEAVRDVSGGAAYWDRECPSLGTAR